MEFVRENAAVALVDVDENAGRRSCEQLGELGGNIKFFHLDVSKRSQVETGVAQIVAEFGQIDILVNNAGIQRYASVTECSEEEWDEVIGVNLKGAFLMAKYVIPHMIKFGGGAIVNTGSVQSISAHRNSVHYVVSKHGLLGLTRSIALDYGEQNVRANCVLAGAIDTPLMRKDISADPNPVNALEACNRMQIRGRMGEPEEVARVIVFLASDQASFMTGSAVVVDGGLLIPAGGMASQMSAPGGAKT
jgi:NAD(P)-dependent dehydrogenase (short-subunit alcohol dehydrogenase family)